MTTYSTLEQKPTGPDDRVVLDSGQRYVPTQSLNGWAPEASEAASAIGEFDASGEPLGTNATLEVIHSADGSHAAQIRTSDDKVIRL